jgi:hypothetical protein
MFKALKHLTSRDRQALAAFLGIAALCFLYFASGILVTYVSSPEGAMEVAKDGRGFTVRVLGLQSYAAAEKLSSAVQDQHQTPSTIEMAPVGQGYLIKIGPLAKRADAETLMNELRVSGYDKANIVDHCPPGTPDCNPTPQNPTQRK